MTFLAGNRKGTVENDSCRHHVRQYYGQDMDHVIKHFNLGILLYVY